MKFFQFHIPYSLLGDIALVITAVLVIAFLLWLLFTGRIRKLLRELRTMWCDVTKNPATSRYSFKRLVMVLAAGLAFFECLTSIIHLQLKPVLEFWLDKPDKVTIGILFGVALTGSVINIPAQYFSRKVADDNGIPLAPIVGSKDAKPKAAAE